MRPSCASSTVMLVLMSGALAGCGWTGRTFTSTTLVPVKAASGAALCQDVTVPVKLGDSLTYSQVQSMIGKLELQQVTVSTVVPDGAGESAATIVHGQLGFAADAQSSATSLVTLDSLSTSGDSAVWSATVEADSTNRPLDATSASALAALALGNQGQFSVQLHACNDATPADYQVEVALLFYLEL